MLQHAPIFGCDSILIDLEDAIAYTEKDSARVMASWFLREFDFKDLFVTVRLNGADTEFFEKDIETIIPCRRTRCACRSAIRRRTFCSPMRR